MQVIAVKLKGPVRSGRVTGVGGQAMESTPSEADLLIQAYLVAIDDERAARETLNRVDLPEVDRAAAFAKWQRAAERSIDLAAQLQLASRRAAGE